MGNFHLSSLTPLKAASVSACGSFVLTHALSIAVLRAASANTHQLASGNALTSSNEHTA